MLKSHDNNSFGKTPLIQIIGLDALVAVFWYFEYMNDIHVKIYYNYAKRNKRNR
jgi:hypothetical protein